MAHQLTRSGAGRRHVRVGAGWLSVLEVLVLAPTAAYLVLKAIPSAIKVEWECMTDAGRVRSEGDSSQAAFAAIGTFGWIAVLAAIVYAEIFEAFRLVALLPLAWFTVLVAAAFVAAVAIGPAPCPV
jgi:hypothetical protein